MDHRTQWNSRFSAQDYIFGTAPNRFLTEQAHRIAPASSVLAVADGEGRNGVWLAQQGHAVTGIDISEVGQEKAAKLAAERGVTLDLKLVDVGNWDWPEAAYDAVVAIFIQFADPAMRERIFTGMKRATKPGGLILMQGYRPEQIGYGTGGPSAVENLYTEELLRTAFDGWTTEHLEAHDSAIEEGAGHKGMSALIDIVARKPA